ncbi:MAG: ATP-binding protein [Bacilli bacterium]|nr:ATP-binding protein [Bacilli bacterium]
MERNIDKYLTSWKKDLIRKPLVLYGPKQVGKTFTAINFGKTEYKNIAYFNTYNNEVLVNLFTKEKAIDKIILNLSLLADETILEDDTLIILDNLTDINIINGLKLFGSSQSKYNIIAITSKSLLNKFKAEELQFRGMYPMSFEEYLIAHNERTMAELIRESYNKRKTCPFHKVALDLFQRYLITGGMPEVIDAELRGFSDNELDAIKQKIIDIYEKDVINNEKLIDIPRSIEIIDSIPNQLSKKNKKFQYGTIKTGTRKNDYKNSIDYLIENQLLYHSYKITTVKSPLSSCRHKDSFKLYVPDDGLLFTMLHLNYKKMITDENSKEILYENHIAKTLTELGYSIYYYQSEGKAEVNFVIQDRMGTIIPIEITTRKDSKAKSLSVFMSKYIVKQGIRITENNFSTKKDIRYIPIYAVFCLNETN